MPPKRSPNHFEVQDRLLRYSTYLTMWCVPIICQNSRLFVHLSEQLWSYFEEPDLLLGFRFGHWGLVFLLVHLYNTVLRGTVDAQPKNVGPGIVPGNITDRLGRVYVLR